MDELNKLKFQYGICKKETVFNLPDFFVSIKDTSATHTGSRTSSPSRTDSWSFLHLQNEGASPGHRDWSTRFARKGRQSHHQETRSRQAPQGPCRERTQTGREIFSPADFLRILQRILMVRKLFSFNIFLRIFLMVYKFLFRGFGKQGYQCQGEP